MNDHSPSGRPAASSPGKGLLERASELFDFRGAIGGGAAPPLDIPAQIIPPPPPPAAEMPPVLAETHRARDWTGPMQPLDRAAMAERGLLLPGAAMSGLGEEFRIIKRELMARMHGGEGSQKRERGAVIQVTSAHSGEGKTFCALNLALSLAAEAGVEVLLVDADFANPELPTMLGLRSEAGLMDVLADPALAIEDFVIRTDIPRLALLPAGQASPHDAEYLGSGQMDALIAALVSARPERILIFDSPPLLAASAASILAAHVDQTLLVVRADRTTEAALRDAAGLLGGSARVSLLLNGVTFSASGRRFGAYPGAEV